MNYIVLGEAQIKVSALSIGTWAFSGAKLWGPNDDNDSIKTIHTAIERGVNFIDTAERYGNGKAEEIIGEALFDRRDKAVICSKVYMGNLGYDRIISSCEESLKRMRTDYLDILSIHWANYEIPMEESLRAFDKLKRDGKIRSVAVCNFGEKNLDSLCGYNIAINQLPYSLVWRVIEKEILPACQKKGVKIWAYSPLGQGLLAGKFKTIEDVPLNRRETRLYNSKWQQGRHSDTGFEKEVFELISEVDEICKETGYSMSAIALGFLKRNDNVASILVGARNIEQINQNIDMFELDIPEAIINHVIKISENLKEIEGNNADLWQDKDGGRIR